MADVSALLDRVDWKGAAELGLPSPRDGSCFRIWGARGERFCGYLSQCMVLYSQDTISRRGVVHFVWGGMSAFSQVIARTVQWRLLQNSL